MSNRREHGDGHIIARGKGVWRLRYYVNGKRHSAAVRGSRTEAKTKLAELLQSARDGEHITPDKMTFAQWVEHWIANGAPGRKQKRAGTRTVERYEQLLKHVTPRLGSRPLQRIDSTDIDNLYTAIMESELAPKTQRHVHVVLKACLDTAKRAGKISANPIERAIKVPGEVESDHGQVLDAEQLKALLRGFKNSTLYPIVFTAASTGARRNEILALRWSDLDVDKKTLRIERAVEETKQHGRRLKGPKTKRGERKIDIADDLIALLLAERDKHRRAVARVPDGAAVNLNLIKLPADALMFPSTVGDDFDCTRLRDPHAVSREGSRSRLPQAALP